MIRTVHLPRESKLAAEAIDNTNHPPSLQLPPGFSRPLAWELANLIRVAYGDFDKYDKQQDLGNLIQVGDTLWLPQNLTYDPIDYFWLQHSNDEPIDSDETDAGPIGDSTAYKVLGVFTYLAFSAGIPPKPEVDRFGFALERDLPDRNKEINFIFRGTIEPSEWFNDFQYKQIPFLQTESGNQASLGEACLGFNKIYTDYRPGLVMDNKTFNKFSRDLDKGLRKAALDQHPEISSEHKAPIMVSVHQVLDEVFERSDQSISINVAGHSLGAALATICALHISILCDSREAHCPVSLYTFASPRVGNPQFARSCNKKLSAFRIANSEDLVPGLPPATLKVIGDEMSPAKHVETVRKALAVVTGGVSDDVFEHVGTPVYFTTQLGEISSNHNMGHTYCSPLRESQPSPPNSSH
ncbi:MAG: lipase family protein [Cyanobacteria bacterium]|nr:lipase family protein [Cyanobacteriota bacterium]